MTNEDNTLGELNMVPVAGDPGPADTVELETADAAPVKKKKAGRPSNAEKAARAAKADEKEAEAGEPEAGEPDAPAASRAVKLEAGAQAGSVTLGVFAMDAGAALPELATAGSGAFDIRANFQSVKEVTVFTGSNKKTTTAVRDQYGILSVILQPHARAMIPTGLIFDIPDGFKLEFYARSGLSLKEGLNLANGQALIDSDYVEESFILIQNNSDLRVEIKHGDRIAQAALARVEPTTIVELARRPAQKTSRAGGLGSTGVQ